MTLLRPLRQEKRQDASILIQEGTRSFRQLPSRLKWFLRTRSFLLTVSVVQNPSRSEAKALLHFSIPTLTACTLSQGTIATFVSWHCVDPFQALPERSAFDFM